MILAIVILSVFFIIVGIIFSLILKHNFAQKNRRRNIGIMLFGLVCLYLFTVNTVYINSKPNELLIAHDYIEFVGSYGVKILYKDIKNIQKITLLPEIESRVKGFSLGLIRKGSFKTSSGEQVYLLVNGNHRPILKITKKNQQKVYFNSAQENIQDEYIKLQNIFAYQKK